MSGPTQIAIVECRNKGCIIQSDQEDYSSSARFTYLNGTPIQDSERRLSEDFLQKRLGLSSLHGVKLHSMAGYFESLRNARDNIGKGEYGKALWDLSSAEQATREQFSNDMTKAAIRSLAQEAIIPHFKIANGISTNRREAPSYKTMSELLGGPLFFHFETVKWGAAANFVDQKTLQSIEDLRPKILEIALKVVSREANRILQTREHVSDRDLSAIWWQLNNISGYANEMKISFNQFEIDSLKQKITEAIPFDSPWRQFIDARRTAIIIGQ